MSLFDENSVGKGSSEMKVALVPVIAAALA
jgi:hypothetical protein